MILTLTGNYSEFHSYLVNNGINPWPVENDVAEWRFYFATQEELNAANALLAEFATQKIKHGKNTKLQEIDTWTAQHITAGFVSSTMGAPHTYDSEQVDQDNIKLMHAASMSPNFETDPSYQGHVPIRAIPSGQTSKVVLMHDKAQLQALIDDMARHIGYCKQVGWQLQAAVAVATTKEDLDAIVWPE